MYQIRLNSGELYHKDHKYLSRSMGKNGEWVYVYPDDTQKTKDLRNEYMGYKQQIRELKKTQKRLERRIADDSIADKGKSKKTLKAGDKLDSTLDKIDALMAKLKASKKSYKELTGRGLYSDTHPEKTVNSYKDKSVKELKRDLKRMQKKSERLNSKLSSSNKTADRHYKSSTTYKEKGHNNRGFQIEGIVGKKYESMSRRYASSLNYTDKEVAKIQKALRAKRRDSQSSKVKQK